MQGKLHISLDLPRSHSVRRSKGAWIISSHIIISHTRTKFIFEEWIIIIIMFLFLENSVCLLMWDFQIFHRSFLKPYALAIHRRHAPKTFLAFKYLSSSANYYLSYLIGFPNYYYITGDPIVIKSEANNFTTGTVKSILGTDIDSYI